MAGSVNYKTIKVTDAVHRQLIQLVTDLNEKGWHYFGIGRSDNPTICNVVEEGITRLKKKTK
jgi:hypothetical protein